MDNVTDAALMTIIFYGIAAGIIGVSIFVIRKVESYDWTHWRLKKNDKYSPEPPEDFA